MNVIRQAYRTLLEGLGPQGWWPILNDDMVSVYSKDFLSRERTEGERLEISIGAILTQSTSWKNVEKALANLKKKGLLDRDKLLRMSEGELAGIIRPAGYFNQKARKLKGFLSYSGPLERESMLKIWGCGRETIDSILLYAHGKPFFVVDAYTKRVFSRMGIIGEGWDYDKIREKFEKSLGKDVRVYREYHALIVELAKRFCRKTPICEGCLLKGMCKHANQLFKRKKPNIN